MDEELGRFEFTIIFLRRADGNMWLDTNWRNEGIPKDSIIMKMRAFVRHVERAYFDSFEQHAANVEKK